MKESAEKVKKALEEAEKAQNIANSAIQRATADIHNTNTLLSVVSTKTCCLWSGGCVLPGSTGSR